MSKKNRCFKTNCLILLANLFYLTVTESSINLHLGQKQQILTVTKPNKIAPDPNTKKRPFPKRKITKNYTYPYYFSTYKDSPNTFSKGNCDAIPPISLNDINSCYGAKSNSGTKSDITSRKTPTPISSGDSDAITPKTDTSDAITDLDKGASQSTNEDLRKWLFKPYSYPVKRSISPSKGPYSTTASNRSSSPLKLHNPNPDPGTPISETLYKKNENYLEKISKDVKNIYADICSYCPNKDIYCKEKLLDDLNSINELIEKSISSIGLPNRIASLEKYIQAKAPKVRLIHIIDRITPLFSNKAMDEINCGLETFLQYIIQLLKIGTQTNMKTKKNKFNIDESREILSSAGNILEFFSKYIENIIAYSKLVKPIVEDLDQFSPKEYKTLFRLLEEGGHTILFYIQIHNFLLPTEANPNGGATSWIADFDKELYRLIHFQKTMSCIDSATKYVKLLRYKIKRRAFFKKLEPLINYTYCNVFTINDNNQ